MPNAAEQDRVVRVAAVEAAITECLSDLEERQVDILMAALIGRLKRLSEYQLKDD